MGVNNGLTVGLRSDGLELFFNAMATLKSRSEWVDGFVPSQANLPRAIREIRQHERNFFARLRM